MSRNQRRHRAQPKWIKITLQEDLDPDADLYDCRQFKIYHDPYLIWGRDTWETIITTCNAYRIELNEKYAGDVILEDRGKGTKYIVDFSVLPEYQGKGIGKGALEKVKKMGWDGLVRINADRKPL